MKDFKFDILPVTLRHKTDMVHGIPVRVESDYISGVQQVINIGVYVDRHIDMTT